MPRKFMHGIISIIVLMAFMKEVNRKLVVKYLKMLFWKMGLLRKWKFYVLRQFYGNSFKELLGIPTSLRMNLSELNVIIF